MKENDIWGWMLTRCIMDVIYNVYKFESLCHASETIIPQEKRKKESNSLFLLQ